MGRFDDSDVHRDRQVIQFDEFTPSAMGDQVRALVEERWPDLIVEVARDCSARHSSLQLPARCRIWFDLDQHMDDDPDIGPVYSRWAPTVRVRPSDASGADLDLVPRHYDRWLFVPNQPHAHRFGIQTRVITEGDLAIELLNWLDLVLASSVLTPDDEGPLPIDITFRVEVVLQETVRVIHEERLAPETAAMLQSAVDTIQAQMKAPSPDRRIIGTMLSHVVTFAGGLMTGVGGNYLTDLIKTFAPWWPR